MTRYNDDPLKKNEDGGYEMSDTGYIQWVGYTSGVDRVLWYIREIKADSRLLEELGFAIKDGVI